MIKSCMLQLITAPCYDAEVMAACLSASSVRRPSQSKELRTLPDLSDKGADGGLDIVAYLNVFSYRVPRRKEEACCGRQHFNHLHPMTYSHQTSYIRTPANCMVLMLDPCLAINAARSKHLLNSPIEPPAN